MAALGLVQHVVIIVKENHTFDNYFGTFPGANGATFPHASDPTRPTTIARGSTGTAPRALSDCSTRRPIFLPIGPTRSSTRCAITISRTWRASQNPII